jgi:hypothetical protein
MRRLASLISGFGSLLLTSLVAAGLTQLILIVVGIKQLLGAVLWLWLALPLMAVTVWLCTLMYLVLFTVPSFKLLRWLGRTEWMNLCLVGFFTPIAIMIALSIFLDLPSLESLWSETQPYISRNDASTLLTFGLIAGSWSMGLMCLYQYVIQFSSNTPEPTPDHVSW